MNDASILRALAKSFLAGEPAVDLIVDRGARTLGRSWKWLRPLARRYLETFSGRLRPRRREVIEFLRRDPAFARARSKYAHEISINHWLTEPQRMQPVPAANDWKIPAIESVGALAEWLGITAAELRWFADLKNLAYKKNQPRLRHYHDRVLAKKSGSIRLIEAPKPRLKQMQRKILTEILETIPCHPAVHGFVKGRSIKTFVAPHVRRRVVLRMDLQDFFPTFSGVRIQAFFRSCGYPETVADLLGGICTTSTPRDAWDEVGFDVTNSRMQEAQRLYARPHLPQGAPTSPALANFCFFRSDSRLQGLASSVGADYTRYADDLAFSSDDPTVERSVERFSIHVAAILMDEGFSVHHRKTRIMRRGVRQHLAGLVANEHLNVIRADFDRLKATLANCVRLGPEGQNREAHPSFRAHLEGRVGFVEQINPRKGKRLREILNQIQWE
jgi:RNA-directed DNA polymerase